MRVTEKDTTELDRALSFACNICDATETQDAVKDFKKLLYKYNLHNFIFIGVKNGIPVLYTNLASHCIIANKPQFFETVIEAYPWLMISQLRLNDGNVALSPLSATVLKRNLSMMQTILSHSTLYYYANHYPPTYINVITSSLELAKDRFKNPSSTEKEIIGQLETALNGGGL